MTIYTILPLLYFADVIALIGDLADSSVKRLRRAVEPLSDLEARHGKYFVSGMYL